MNWDKRFNQYLKTKNLRYAEPNYEPIEDKIKKIANKQMKKKQKSKEKIQSMKSLLKGIAQNKPLFKEQKLGIVLPYQKGELILNQRSPFFRKEYAREKSLLSWN